jgi:hypothetical protein
MRRKATEPGSSPTLGSGGDADLESAAHGPGGGGAAKAGRHLEKPPSRPSACVRFLPPRRRVHQCCRVSCALLCLSLAFGLIVAAVKIKPLADSYGYEVPYFLVAPLWFRWLTEATPHIITPAPGLDGYIDTDMPPAEGAERFGEFWVSRVASKPNVTIVHNFMSKAECASLRELATKMGLLPANQFKVGNVEGGEAADRGTVLGEAVTLNSILDAIYKIVRTSAGDFLELEALLPSELAMVLAIMRRAEHITAGAYTLVHFSAQLERFVWDRGCA